MRIAVGYSGPTWSTADVEAGLVYGLEQQGVDVVRWPEHMWAETRPDAVILVTAIRQALAAIRDIVGESIPVTALFTESPYEADKELAVAQIVAGCWTHERSAVETFRAVQPHVAYLPHAWHPDIHTATSQSGDADVPAHDVVFVGSGFRERVTFFNAVDWTGIDLGLYGIWEGFGLTDQVAACVREGPIPNRYAAALYRRARIGLNLYRRLHNLGPDVAANWVHAESLNPRAYELAACGCVQISESRPEIRDVFGYTLAKFTTSAEASVLLRRWLAMSRFDLSLVSAGQLACVAHASWIDRAAQVLRDLQAWGLTS